MTEHENLPAVLATRALAAATEKRSSLVGRGLLALHRMGKQQEAEKLFKQGMCYRYGDDTTQVDDDKAQDYLTKASELDHAEAQFELAFLLGDKGVPDQWDEILEWFKKSAHLGFCPALRTLWEFQENLECDDPEAVLENELDALFVKASEWYESRATAGDAKSQFEFAKMLLSDPARRTHGKRGYYWLKKSAAQDHIPACIRLGVAYLRTVVTDHTTAQGIYWLSRAADLGSERACEELGDFYLLGHAGGFYADAGSRETTRRVEPDKPMAIGCYERGIAMGSRQIAYELGRHYLYGEHLDQNPKLAEKWLLHSAKNGHLLAPSTLGSEYASGARLQQDTEAAIYWLSKAVKHLKSTGLKLAEIYLDGNITSRNFQEAMKWLDVATESFYNSNRAMVMVAEKCFDGRFGASEESAAKAWLVQMASKAIETVALANENINNYISNAYHLGQLYDWGLGVEKDMGKAIYWYRQSAVHGLHSAKARLNELGISWAPK